jgi:hypothetical protein
VTAEHTKGFSFPNLRRPSIPPHQPATQELVNWGAKVYCFSWLRHFSTLVNGIITLRDAGNAPSALVVARSVFELGAHAYYVKKHLKQHIDAKNLDAAWKFLTPIAIGSRYINEYHPEGSEMFPPPAHISKAIAAFVEVMPENVREDYSFLSEYCHPNMLAFLQYYRWLNPYEIGFVDHEPQGIFGSTAAACIMGLMAIQETLGIVDEKVVAVSLRKLFQSVVEQAAGGSKEKAAGR